MRFRRRPTSPKTDSTVVADLPLVVMLVCVAGGTVVVGLGELGWEWLTAQSWGPRIGPTKLLTELPGPWPTVIAAAVGAVAGFLLGANSVHESVSVTVSAERVVLTSRGERREFAGDEIGRVFLASKQLVLLDRNGQELARQNCDLSPRRLSTAFVQHGYSWVKHTPGTTT